MSGLKILNLQELPYAVLHWLAVLSADGSIYYPKRKQRDESARLKYRQPAMQTDLDGIYMRDILRDKIMPGLQSRCMNNRERISTKPRQSLFNDWQTLWAAGNGDLMEYR